MSAQPDRPDDELCIEDFVNVPAEPEPAESDESAVSEFERLTGVTTLKQEQQADTDRVVDDSVTQDVARAMEDGHDFSDCGGDE